MLAGSMKGMCYRPELHALLIEYHMSHTGMLTSILFCRCRQWVHQIKRADLDKKGVGKLTYDKLCSNHFEQDQFMNPDDV